MRFNFDILICLMRLTQERRDVSATMRTCRALYSAGMPSLLSFDIDFGVWDRFVAFCSFMDVDAPRRSRFLRQMTLYMHHLSNSFSTGTLDHILCILQHATQLHQLRITTYVRGGPRPLDPRLIGALSSLTSIKHLTLGETSNDTVMILQSLHSPVAEARVDFKSGSDVDPILVLRNFSSSLQQLAALGSPVFPRAPHYDIQYSLVTKLEISVRIGSPIPLKPLIYSFPNLRVLRLVDEVDLDQVQPFEGDIALAGEGCRQANILSHSQRHWEALDHVSSDILNLYLLGLSCKVHHLHLEFARCYGVDNLRLIKETLSMIRPTRLHIRVFDDVDFNPTQLDRTVDDLTHLHINFIICSSELVDTPQVVDGFIALLPPLACMTHFALQLEWEDNALLEICEDLLQIASLANRVMEAAPAVQYISLKWYTMFGAGSSVWQVLRSGDISSLRELTGKDAQRVESELGLGLHF